MVPSYGVSQEDPGARVRAQAPAILAALAGNGVARGHESYELHINNVMYSRCHTHLRN